MKNKEYVNLTIKSQTSRESAPLSGTAKVDHCVNHFVNGEREEGDSSLGHVVENQKVNNSIS